MGRVHKENGLKFSTIEYDDHVEYYVNGTYVTCWNISEKQDNLVNEFLDCVVNDYKYEYSFDNRIDDICKIDGLWELITQARIERKVPEESLYERMAIHSQK